MLPLNLHHGNLRGFARKRPSSISLVLKRIRAGFGVLHRRIVSAKLQRGRSEFLFRKNHEDMLLRERDVTKYPQRPLILGDKWDF